jgi:hypothetical protein
VLLVSHKGGISDDGVHHRKAVSKLVRAFYRGEISFKEGCRCSVVPRQDLFGVFKALAMKVNAKELIAKAAFGTKSAQARSRRQEKNGLSTRGIEHLSSGLIFDRPTCQKLRNQIGGKERPPFFALSMFPHSVHSGSTLRIATD